MRVTPSTLRVLLLTALGASFTACGGKSDCEGGTCVAPSGSGATTMGSGARGGGGTGSQVEGSSGGGPVGGSPAGGGTGGDSAVVARGCTNPTSLIEGVETGIFMCEEGYLHRAEALQCPSPWPRDNQVEWPAVVDEMAMGGASATEIIYERSTDECSTDTDCSEDAFCVLQNISTALSGLCTGAQEPPEGPTVVRFSRLCVAGCREDSDCGDSQVCVCGDLGGVCASVSSTAGCKSDGDCEGEALCLKNARSSRFDAHSFACELPGDTCATDQACEADTRYCLMGVDGRKCEEGAVCGRPFFVFEEVRQARAISSSAWISSGSASEIGEGVSRLEPPLPDNSELRRSLCDHYTEIALMEHASVAAFARFTLQLLSMGAPAVLIEASNQAQMDETRHARIAFGLASAYGGRALGPGPLNLEGALHQSSWEEILRLTFREGCVGETHAALEVAMSSEAVEYPALKEALRSIADDESRHAELAWRTVQWILNARPELADIIEEEIEEARQSVMSLKGDEGASSHQRVDPLAAAHGALNESARRLCARRAFESVIEPCGRALLASLRPSYKGECAKEAAAKAKHLNEVVSSEPPICHFEL